MTNYNRGDIMAKVQLPYTVYNKLPQYIQTYADQQNISQKELEHILAEYCSISWEGIRAIKYKDTIPSLPLAEKIAQYFGVTVEDIWPLKEQ